MRTLTNMAASNVSTKLKTLRERKLVECVNPADRKWFVPLISPRTCAGGNSLTTHNSQPTTIHYKMTILPDNGLREKVVVDVAEMHLYC